MSLDGGADGLRDLLTVFEQAQRLLLPGGVLACECGETQVKELLARRSSWMEAAAPLYDATQRPRGVLVTRTRIATAMAA